MTRVLCCILSILLLLATWGCGLGEDAPPTVFVPPATATVPHPPSATPAPAPPTATAAPLPPTPSPPPAPSATPPPDPGPPPVYGDLPRFAIDPIDQYSPEAITALQASGTQLVRMFLAWSVVEPVDSQPPAYHWDTYDPVLARFAAAGIGVIISIQNCPAWACTDSSGPLDKAPATRFAAFVAALGARYSAAPYNVHAWEIFNEPDTTNPPNHQGAFGLHGDLYAALLKAAVPGLRAADPKARVLLGGLGYEWFMDEQPPGPFNRNFLRDVVQAGGAPYFDYLNFHYYPQNPHWPSIADKALTLRKLQHSLGIDKPLICTEVGITTGADPRWTAPGWPPNSEAVQSRFLVRAYAEGLAGGITTMTWFTLHDWQNSNPGLQIFLQTGLTRADWSYKPGLTAYHTLVQTIGARPVVRTLDAAILGTPVLTGVAFGKPGDEVWIVWSRAEKAVPLALPAGVPVRATDLYGAPLSTNAGTLSVGPDPVYLIFGGAR